MIVLPATLRNAIEQQAQAEYPEECCGLLLGRLDDGRKVTKELVRTLVPEELEKVRTLVGEDEWKAGRYEEAARLFEEITTNETYVEFLTLPAYDMITHEVQAEREPAPAYA